MAQNKTFAFPTDRITLVLLVIGNGLFLILFIILSYYDRLATDDLHFLALSREYDVITAVRFEYFDWSARWASVLLNQIVLSFHQYRHSLLIFNLVVLVFFIFAIHRLIGNFSHLFRAVKMDRWLHLNLSIFIVSAFFYASKSIDETWFWLCSTCTYLVGMIMLIMGIASILSPSKGIMPAIGCIIGFAYLGGSCEPLALFSMLVLAMVIVHGAITRSYTFTRPALALIACAISFAILYAGEGNRVRESFFEEIGLLRSVVQNVKITGMILLLKLPQIFPIVLLFTIPAYVIGARSSTITDRRRMLRRVLLISAIYFIAIFILQLPVTYVTHDIAADRTLFPITFFSLIAGSCIFYSIGMARIRIASRPILICSFGGSILLNYYTIFDQVNELPKYARAYDARIEYLTESREMDGIIVVEPLPSSGLLLSAEIDTDPAYHANQALKAGLGMKGDVIREPFPQTQ
ncbi:MAG: hypothetical protein M3R08_04810 [Bacteroidota bacterium]|nr:hypothetical protein [Bacteroidota bacterium]